MTDNSTRGITDWHTHCYLPEHRSPEAMAERIKYGVRGGEAWPEEHRAAMDEGNITQFVVVNVPRRPGHEVPNEFIAEYCSQYPGRAIGLASVHPNDPTAFDDFENSVKNLGLKGLKLSPVYQGFDPWSPEAWRLYYMAQDFGVPVMFHMGGMYDPKGTLEWGDVLALDKVARAARDLKIIVAHFGQPQMQETVMLLRKNLNVFTDLSARFHRKWQLYNGLQVAIEYKVTDRILFGSDFPVMKPSLAADAFRNINDWGDGIKLPPIPADFIDEVLHNRPFSIMGLDA